LGELDNKKRDFIHVYRLKFIILEVEENAKRIYIDLYLIEKKKQLKITVYEDDSIE